MKWRFGLLMLALMLSACTTTPAVPRVTINMPTNAGIFDAGQTIPVQSVAEDAQGIARVDLLVDGQTIKSDASPNGTAQKSFAVTQTWQATGGGLHVIVVRATSTQGRVAEAAVSVTVIEKTATPAPTPMKPTPTPSKAVVVASAVAPTKAPAPTSVPTAIPATTTRRTLTFTEAQINTLISKALTTSSYDFITASSVSLQNGHITVKGTGKMPGGVTTNGTVVAAVSASHCDFKVVVTQASIGTLTLSDARKAQMNAAISKALASSVAPQYDYRCIEAVTITSGVMTVVYR